MEEINLVELLRYFLKKTPLIVFITLLVTMMGLFYIQIIQVPMYHGTSTILLVQDSNKENDGTVVQNEVKIDEKIVSTYSNLIKSRRVLNQVISSLELNTTENDLSNQITITSVSDTPIIKITVSDSNNQQAAIIANKLATVFKQEIMKIYDLEIVSVIDEAIVEEQPYNINKSKQMIIYFTIGLVLSFTIVFALFYFDDTIKNRREIEEKLNMPVLGEVPLAKKLITNYYKDN